MARIVRDGWVRAFSDRSVASLRLGLGVPIYFAMDPVDARVFGWVRIEHAALVERLANEAEDYALGAKPARIAALKALSAIFLTLGLSCHETELAVLHGATGKLLQDSGALAQ